MDANPTVKPAAEARRALRVGLRARGFGEQRCSGADLGAAGFSEVTLRPSNPKAPVAIVICGDRTAPSFSRSSRGALPISPTCWLNRVVRCCVRKKPPAAAPSASDSEPPLVLDAAGRQKLVEEATGKSARQVRRMLADLDPELAVPADRMRPLGDGRYELKAVIDADCQQGLEQLRGLRSHVDPRMTLGQLVGRIVQEALDRHDPSRPPRRARTGNRPAADDSKPAAAAKDHAAPESGHAVTVQDAPLPAAATPTPERTPQPTPSSAPAPNRQAATERRAAAGRKPNGAATPTAKPRASGRAIPAAVKRQVWQRDGGRCNYVDRQTGRRCNSRHLIEIDHILPYAMGGSADLENLRLLCGVHHRHRHAPHGSRRIPDG